MLNRPNTSRHWIIHPSWNASTVHKSPVTGKIIPLNTVSATKFLQPLGLSTRKMRSYVHNPPVTGETHPLTPIPES